MPDTPRPATDIVEDGVPAIDEQSAELLATGEQAEGEMAPLDDPQGVEEFGTTAAEQRLGESVAQRADREQPERLGEDPDADAGLVEDDTPSAEEAAMRVEAEPAGMNYDEDPGYLS